jgi:hypothetical protein
MVQVQTETTKTVADIRRHGLEAKIVEFADDFVQGLDIIWREFETQLNEVEGRAVQGVDGSTGTDTCRIEAPIFDRSTSYAVFRRQFEATAGHYKWATCAKATHLLVALQGSATDVLHGVPKEVTYEAIEALEDCFGDQHLAAAYGSQLKIRNYLVGESLKEFAKQSNNFLTATIRHYPKTT